MVSLTFRGHTARVPRTFTSWTVKEKGQDEREFNRWTNKDILPVPAEERNYGFKGYFGFWSVKQICKLFGID
jgi:NCS1 family nucleobase:cation symporter-1